MKLSFTFTHSVMKCATITGALTLSLSQVAAADTLKTYDWVAFDHLTPEQKADVGPACKGAYIDPLAGAEDSDPATTDIHIGAQSSSAMGNKISLEGDVAITQGSRQLKAQHMSYDKGSGDARLEGKVELRQSGVWVGGDKAELNMSVNEAEFAGGKFVLHETHMRGTAENIRRSSNGVVTLKNGSVTSCEPGSESWLIQGKELKVNPNTRQGSGKHVSIRLAGVPIFYAPYLTFPVGSGRQTGLLVPSVGSSEGGLDLSIPWYWNIAPNMDATIAPRYAEGHGAMIEGEYRYLNRYSHNSVTLAYLPDDEGGGDPDIDALIAEGVEENLLRPYKNQNRWLLAVEHQGGDASRWYSDIDFAKTSDIDYFRDLAVASFEVANNTYLNQSVLLGYRLPNWHLQLRLQDYQSLLADVADSYRQTPRFNATGRYPVRGLELSLKQEFVRFDHSDPSFIEGNRLNLDYQLSWEKHWSYGFINPNAGVQALAYNLDGRNLKAGVDSTPHFLTPYASLDAGLVFERNNGQQTLEPHVFYLYRDYEDQSSLYDVTSADFGPSRDVNFDTTPLTFGYHQLFRDTRFSGGDRLDDANQLTLGITSVWTDIAETNISLDVSFGQIFYFAGRQVQLSNTTNEAIEESDLATQISAKINQNVRLHSDFLYNPKSKLVMRSSNGVEYRNNDGGLINVGYRYVREDTITESTLPVDQLDTSFAWPVGDQWQLVGRAFYDIDEHKSLDTFIGFEYDDCCYRVRFLARRWLDSKLAALVNDKKRHYDDALFLEIDLKGLASSGDSIKNLLFQSIPGFGR